MRSDSRWRAALGIVFRTALPGITTAVLIAFARVAGETAPLLFTVGAFRKVNVNPFSGTNSSLSLQIYEFAKQVKPNLQERGWGAAFTLVAIAFLFTLLARIVTSAYQKRR